MNLLFEIVIQQGFILDLFGVIGLGLLALGAIRIARRMDSRHASMMAWGALAMLAGRVGILIYGNFFSATERMEWVAWQHLLGRDLPLALLTLGLGAILYGFWSHEQESSEAAEAS